MLFIMSFRVYTFEAWMTVDRVNNILAAVDSVGVTNSICGHYVIHRSSCKPTQGTSKLDIGQYLSFWKKVPRVLCLSFPMRQLCMDAVPQQDTGKFRTSFNMPSESRHRQVDCKRPGLTFAGAFERYIQAETLNLSFLFFASYNTGAQVHEL
jgi:hypothetical protein